LRLKNLWSIKKLIILIILLSSSYATAGSCGSGFINPLTEISWKCIFPMTIAGIKMAGGEDTLTQSKSPICTCMIGPVPSVGLKTSFWEPSRIVDTVSKPYCLMPLGTVLSSASQGRIGGALSNQAGSGRVFQQMHYYIFPVWQVLDMFYDIPCVKSEGFDVGMLTEIVPTWNSDMLAMILNPEAILFGNPLTQIACAADAAQTIGSMPRPELFWCMGSWGNAYPLAGSITSTDFLEANAGIAARGVYMMGRLGLLWESTDDGCYTQPAPIWTKDRYKLQLAKPVTDHTCIPIGRDSLLWGAGRHNLNKDDFMWMLFKKNDCCIGFF
jgi:conjugal transfer pilus assembly protein TraU